MSARRGRILQSFSGQAESRLESQNHPDGIQIENLNISDTESRQRPTEASRAVRGRGAFRTLINSSSRSEVGQEQVSSSTTLDRGDRSTPRQPQQPARPRAPSSPHQSDTSSSENRPSRQGSDLSRSSIVSQQFANVEQTIRKPKLQKEISTAGTPFKMTLNYMTFNVSHGTSVSFYHVNFEPNIESISLRRRLLRSDAAVAVLGNTMSYTGVNLYLPIKLPQTETNLVLEHPVTGSQVKISVRYVKTPPEEEMLLFYNNLIRQVMKKLKYVLINRQFYSPVHKITIDQHRLEVWPGWITSIQNLDGGLKLSIDASFRVLRLETVRDIMMLIKNRAQGNLKEAFEQELVGCIIMTRYNNESYRIDGIDITKNPTHQFVMTSSGNRSISYIDYMREHWSIDIQDHGQPLIIHRPKPKRGQADAHEIIYLIPELCVTTGLTDEMRSNFNIMKAIGEHTRLPPDVRESKLNEFLTQLSTDERALNVLESWGLAVRPQIDIVDGRRLDNETVIFGGNRSHKVQDNADWSRPATTTGVFKSAEIKNWVLMVTERDVNIASDLMKAIQEVSRQLDIKFHPPRLVKLPNDQSTTYVNAGKREVKQTDQMVVIMTPGRSQREDRYSACKRLFSCDFPIPCQFIRCGTVSNPMKIRSICQKIVIQVLCKVGGQPWAMKFPMKSFMIVGIDVYHDTIDRNRSCLGFVASMNEFTTSWWSHTFFQNSLEEIGQKLNTAMINAIKRYHSINGFIPQRIIVYRDGVGDNQFEVVLNVEIPQIINGIQFYMRDSHADVQHPQISYIIVQKRIGTKLGHKVGNRTMNPAPGSYIDHTITHPEYVDFYLVSQHVNQGTVSPTKYVILTETGSLKPEHHQKLAYKMTHMYFNWCGTIRVPAPCQYAHKLAYLCGQNIRQKPSDKLEDKLYYL